MARRFTPSRDGVERTTLRLTIRLTHEEYEKAKALAKRTCAKNVHVWASSIAELAIEGEFDTIDEY
jgi:hypothetical protein